MISRKAGLVVFVHVFIVGFSTPVVSNEYPTILRFILLHDCSLDTLDSVDLTIHSGNRTHRGNHTISPTLKSLVTSTEY